MGALVELAITIATLAGGGVASVVAEILNQRKQRAEFEADIQSDEIVVAIQTTLEDSAPPIDPAVIDAIRSSVRQEFEREEGRAFWRDVTLNFSFFALGIIVTVVLHHFEVL